MATSHASLDALPDDLAARYGLPPLAPFEPLGGGYHNILLRAGDVVVRVEERTPESVAWEHELVLFLADAIPEVVAPLRAHETAQREIRRYAEAVETFLAERMPITYEAFVAGGRVAP